MEILTPRLRVALALTAVCVIWGSTYFGMFKALESFPPFLMGGIRFTIAGGLLLGFLRARGSKLPTLRQWGFSFAIGGLLIVVSNGGIAVAEHDVDSGVCAVIVATLPLWTALVARFWGERSSRGELVGLGVGFAGVVVLNMNADLLHHGWSTVAVLVSPAAWALGSIWSKHVSLPAGSMAVAAQMFAGGLLLFVVSGVSGESMHGAPSASSLAALLYLIVFGSLVAYSAYGYLLRATRHTTATAYAYVNPVVALVIGAAFNGEKISVYTVVGTAVILAGILVMSLAKRAAPAKVAPVEDRAEEYAEPAQ